MAIAPFQIQADLTGIAIAYQNEEFIADRIAPRRMVGAKSFEWDLLDPDLMFQTTDDQVGRLSKPNQVTWSSTRTSDKVFDHALDAPVPNEDMENHQGVGPTPYALATELVTHRIELNREIRVANWIQTAANYKTTNRVVLSGASRFLDSTSNPTDAVLAALDTCLVRPNVGVINNVGARFLRQHPRLVEALKGTGAGPNAQGLINLSDIASLWELDAIYVGRARAKTSVLNIGATPGTPTPARIWGGHFALITVDPMAQLTITQSPTTLLTAQYGTRVAGTIQEPDMGMRGGVRVRSGECVKEVSPSNEGAYFFENAFV
jgi:hypothetical protein